MSRIRQQNVTAAQWSSDGEALGAIDLTLPENAAFGANVFDVVVQKERLPADVFERLQATLEGGEALDPSLAHARAPAPPATRVRQEAERGRGRPAGRARRAPPPPGGGGGPPPPEPRRCRRRG